MNALYEKYAEYRRFVDDVYRGTCEVKSKEKAKIYLPPHPSEIGHEDRYRSRFHLTHFENAFRPIIDAIVGIMQKCPATVQFGVESDEESPKEVRDLEVYGNAQNDGLSGLKRRLNFAQALFGRAGLLLGIEDGAERNRPKFVIREYAADKILDGEQGKWALLDESTDTFDSVTKKRKIETRWRVIALDGQGWYYTCPIVGELADVQKAWENFDLFAPPSEAVYPTFRGQLLDVLPLTVCNAKTIGFDGLEEPPYYDAAQAVIDAYNSDSFYRRAIANHATPTVVVSNAKQLVDKNGKEIPLEVGGVFWLDGAGTVPADVKLIQASSDGLNAMKQSKDDILDGFKRISIQDLLDRAGANSSGDAIQLRMMSGTATIAEIDHAGGKAIEEQLCYAAYWAGATWEEVGERISYKVDIAYAKTDFMLSEVVNLMMANANLKLFAPQVLYELIRLKAPGVMPEWEDNLAQMQAVQEEL